MPNPKHYIDHEGNEFDSMLQMAKFWNISKSTLQRRLSVNKMSIKDALTKTESEIKFDTRKCQDHLGNEFPSKIEMCKHYNIPTHVFFGRIRIGWSLKDALTQPLDYTPKNTKTISDHTGQTFKSITDMCKYWNMTRVTYNARIKAGWTIEAALTTPKKTLKTQKQKWKDHLGNEYESLNQMCRKYNITHHTFSTRMKKLGWDIEKALTYENVINASLCKDYKNREFPTKRDLANYYNLPASYVQGKHMSDDELKSKITKRWLSIKTIGDLKIKQAINFPYFLVEKNNYDYIYSLEDILDIYHNTKEFNPIPPSKIQDKSLQIIECVGFPNYKISFKNNIEIWSYWDIINYRHDTNFGLSNNK